MDSRSFIPIQCGHIIRNDRSRDIRQIYLPPIEITQKLLQLCTLDINRTSRPVVFGTVTKIILQYAGVPDRHPVIVAADSPGAAELVNVIQESNCPAGRSLFFIKLDGGVRHIHTITLKKVCDPRIRPVNLYRILNTVVSKIS